MPRPEFERGVASWCCLARRCSPLGSPLPSTSAARHRGRLQHSGAGRAFSEPACRRAAGSAFPTDISLTAGGVGSPGLAIMIRPDLAEPERRRGDPPTRRCSFSRLLARTLPHLGKLDRWERGSQDVSLTPDDYSVLPPGSRAKN